MSIATVPLKLASWRTPAVLIAFGCVIAVISFGPRSSLGFFLTPLTSANGWGRDVFGLALAIQNLLWGLGQPFAGAIADKYGAPRVLSFGAVLYAAGLYLMTLSTTPGMLYISAGVLIGFGLSGCAMPAIIGALGKLVPDNYRSLAFGAGTAAGSFGQFLYSPLAVSLNENFDWHTTLVIFSCLLLLIVPLSLTLMGPRGNQTPERPSTGRIGNGSGAKCFRSVKRGLTKSWRKLQMRRCSLSEASKPEISNRMRAGANGFLLCDHSGKNWNIWFPGGLPMASRRNRRRIS